MRKLAAGLLIAAVSGCVSHPPDRHHRRPPAGAGPMQGVFISPMGEPFRGPGGRPVLIGRWFDGVDADHDGRISPTEFRQDALRFFRVLDTNGDGEIDPDELRHYETEVAPEVRVGDAALGAKQSGGGGGRRGGGRGGGGGGGGGRRGGGSSGETEAVRPSQTMGVQGAARFSLLDLPEPVAAADTDLNRSITAREFAAAATQRFVLLDTDNDGFIERHELAIGDSAHRSPR
ncbi:MAG: hypothetical protein ACRYG4_24120 [Janthinobacterium lividum]